MSIEAQKLQKTLDETIETELLALAERLVGIVKEKTPVGAAGHLRGSFVARATMQAAMKAVTIGSPLEYGAYVEFGTSPHWPPFEPIRRWVERKIQPHILAIGVTAEQGKIVPTGRATRVLKGDARTRAIAKITRAIQAKIAQAGTRGVFMMKQALDEVGLKYKVVASKDGMIYNIDIATWLAERIANKLKMQR